MGGKKNNKVLSSKVTSYVFFCKNINVNICLEADFLCVGSLSHDLLTSILHSQLMCRPESNMLKSLSKMLPGISPKFHLYIMLLSVPIMLALCS